MIKNTLKLTTTKHLSKKMSSQGLSASEHMRAMTSNVRKQPAKAAGDVQKFINDSITNNRVSDDSGEAAAA